jgi:uncharacterized protein YdeI (YjbR/CyaY-like superfamily)
MKMERTLHVTTRADWRTWLGDNARTQSEVWLVFSKVRTGAPALPYEDAVEEALCFGWIDSLIQRIDDQRYARLFSPRRQGSPWSEVNKRRLAKMVKAGLMTEAGLALFPFPIPEGDPGPAPKRTIPALSQDLEAELRANSLAWENYQKLPPSAQRLYSGWIMSAKKEETRRKRLGEAIGLLEQGKRLENK